MDAREILHVSRQANQMLKTYTTMSQRVRPRKAAEKGVAAAAAVVREKWGALQHLHNQLQSLPENPARGEDGPHDEAAVAALAAALAAASRDQGELSGSGSGRGPLHQHTHLKPVPGCSMHLSLLHSASFLQKKAPFS